MRTVPCFEDKVPPKKMKMRINFCVHFIACNLLNILLSNRITTNSYSNYYF